MHSNTTTNASISPIQGGWRFSIEAGQAGRYRLAQVDDYRESARRQFPHRPPLILTLQARASHANLPGTWGFGLWNNPFGLSFGFGTGRMQLPRLPNAAWFFHASEANYLSFAPDALAETDKITANGFMAKVFRSPIFHPRLVTAGLNFLISRERAREHLHNIIEEDGAVIDNDVTAWHEYRLQWTGEFTRFWLDDQILLDSPVSPNAPLGLVIWIDNQFAAWQSKQPPAWGTVANPVMWLEVKDLMIH